MASRKVVTETVWEVIRPFSSIPLVVGVSGGPDSLALLHILKTLSPANQLVVAHVNHGLRSTAVSDAYFVQQTAVSWNLPYFIETIDVAQLAQQKGMSLEEAGRTARYRFFAQVAEQVGAKSVVVAHNADDQAETVLMHLLRGSGLAGLQGMLSVGKVPGNPELNLIRPFLQISRTDIEAYCQEFQLNARIDGSNQDITFFRNRVRHELIPLLAQSTPHIKERLQQLSAVIQADEALLAKLTTDAWTAVFLSQGNGWLKLHKSRWTQLPLSLKRRVLRQAVAQLRPSLQDIGFSPIEQARLIAESSPISTQATLPGNLTLTVGYEELTITAVSTAPPITLPQLLLSKPQPLPIPGSILLANGWALTTTPLHVDEATNIGQNPDPWTAFIAGSSTLHVRPRADGERFWPLGMAGNSAKVQDVMVNRKIPAPLRPLWPIVANENHLVWLVGHHIDERVRITAETRNLIQLRCWPTP